MVAVGMNLSSTFDTIAGSSKLRLPKRSASAAAVVAFVVAALFPPPPYRVLRGDRVSHASRRASETVPSRQVHPQPTGSSRRRSPRSDRSLLARDYKPSATRTYPNAGLALPAPASSGRILRAAVGRSDHHTVRADHNGDLGQDGVLLAGAEFPVPIAGTRLPHRRSPSVSSRWRRTRLSPTILETTHVSLKVQAEVRRPTAPAPFRCRHLDRDDRSQRSPSLRGNNSRPRQRSKLRLARLLGHQGAGHLEGSLPWLGDVLILGQLFSSQLLQRNERPS